MKKNNKSLLFFGFFLLLFSIMACRLPFKIVPNNPETATIPATVSPKPSATTQAHNIANQTTPTLENTEIVVDSSPAAGSVLTWIDYSNFVFVPSGEYIMGKDSTDQADYSPLHPVSLDGFWIQQSEVTNQQYAQCVSDGKCSPPNQDPEVPYWFENIYHGNYPVVGITWFQAREYCSYIQSRLPTEAEWEAAARGPEAKMFPWGGDKPNCNYLNFKGCREPVEPNAIRYFSFGASDFQVFDMAGNVFEWVEDWYAKDFYASSTGINPTGPLDGRKKVFRGGSYKSESNDIGSFLRFSTEPENQASDLGFRCVLPDDVINESNINIGQPCQVVGMSDPQNIPATSTPFPCSAASVTGFCKRYDGIASYGVEILQSGCLDNVLHSMTGNSQPLSCSVIQLSDGGNKYQCTFPGMAQGINMNVNYCHSLTIPKADIICPLGYHLNQNFNFCEVENAKLPVPPCPQGYFNVPPYGCLPINDSNYGACPIGYYSIETTSASVCMPVNKCLLSTSLDSCTNTTCASGQRFDNIKNCCVSADTPKKVCPSNLLYNSDQNMCLGQGFYAKKCLMTVSNIPYCPTLTPTPTPTPVPVPNDPQPKDCSIYKDGDTCRANGCNWTVGWIICYE